MIHVRLFIAVYSLITLSTCLGAYHFYLHYIFTAYVITHQLIAYLHAECV